MTFFLYTLGIAMVRGLYLIASFVHPKAQSLRNGHRAQKARLRETFPLPEGGPLIWFHCASLGEFEQGRPVIESLKASRPDVKVLLTFFSPSGYEVRKNYPLADHVFYLPWDTSKTAEWFATEVRPAIAVFVKYEFWFHYSRALRQHHIPLISISAIFRPSHIYFKSFGFAFRTILKNFSYFFVQNDESLRLLKTIGIANASVAGDTRFDRVAAVASQSFSNPIAEAFKGSQKVMVIGSAWQEDMAILTPFMNRTKGSLKFMVAPHELNERFMESIEKGFDGNSVRYSRTTTAAAASAELLLIDTVGMLAQLYRYGEFAFIGGGFKQGLHNTLEAACYGVPIFFGGTAPYDKFQEAVDLVSKGGAFAISNLQDLDTVFGRVSHDEEAYKRSAGVCRNYVQINQGATQKITDYLLKTLSTWKAV